MRSTATTIDGVRSRLPGAVAGILSLLLLAGCGGEQGGQEEGAEEAPSAEMTRVEGVGFQGPESVIHDPSADVYLVSNINGGPTDKDGNGFISRVSPDGSVAELKWIDGAAEGVELDAPKGSAIVGDSLYVADIDCVRVFVLSTGDHSHDICFEEATFLNDVTADANDILYVTDSGTEDAEGAIYRFNKEGGRAPLLEGENLGGPNGLVFTPRGILVVTMGSGEIFRVTAEGERTPVAPRSERRLDGIVFRSDESFFFSDWADSAVYKVGTDGSVEELVQGVPSPADIGYDAQRHRLLIPLLQENAVVFRDVEPPQQTPAGQSGESSGTGAGSGGEGSAGG